MLITKFICIFAGVMKKFLFFMCVMALLAGCMGRQSQPKAYGMELTSSDSMVIRMGNYDLIKYHSDKLGLDINYPSFLVRQELPESEGMQELFMIDDISISVTVDSVNNMMRSSGQVMLAMGADLNDVGDDYSIHEGSEDNWDYYSKVIDSDSLRQITVILRYNPEHEEAVEALKEWVRNYQ